MVVIEVQELVDRHSSLQSHERTLRRVWDAYRVGSADLDTLRGRLTFYTSTIDMFLHSLEGPALARIEGMVRLLVANMGISQAVPGSGSRSIASVASTATILSILDPDQEDEAWKFLTAELMAEGILPSHLKMYEVDIIGYVKTLIEGVETPLVLPVSAQASEPVKRDLHLANIPTPKLVLPILSVGHEWSQDSDRPFEYRPITLKHGMLTRDRTYWGAYSGPICLLCIERRPLASFHWGPERATYEFLVHTGFKSLPFGGALSIEKTYPKSACSLVHSPPWTVGRIRKAPASWKLDSIYAAVSQRPGTFRLAMVFRIPIIDLRKSVPFNITLRYMSQGASGRTQIFHEHTARLMAVPEASNHSFTDFQVAQEVKNATRGIYTEFLDMGDESDGSGD